jgi:hypothetical protein
MEPKELMELQEEARESHQRVVGLTTAVVAALLAAVVLMGHRLNTEEIVMQTKSADGWAYYQAKNTRSQMYATDAKLAEIGGRSGAALAATWSQKADEEKKQADDIRKENETRDQETNSIARQASYFDAAEVCLEMAIVLCSIALLADNKFFWRLSFIGTAAGLGLAAWGFITH